MKASVFILRLFISFEGLTLNVQQFAYSIFIFFENEKHQYLATWHASNLGLNELFCVEDKPIRYGHFLKLIYNRRCFHQPMLMLECITSPKKPRLTFFKLIPVLTSCGLSRLKRCEDGASAIHSVKKRIPRRTDQVWRAAFNPQRLSCDSDIRLIKMSEAIHLINGRDKTLPMFSSRGDLEAIHAFLGP